MRIDAIEISQIEGDTLYFRARDEEADIDNVAALREAIEKGVEFSATDLLGRELTVDPANIEKWEERRVEDSAL